MFSRRGAFTKTTFIDAIVELVGPGQPPELKKCLSLAGTFELAMDALNSNGGVLPIGKLIEYTSRRITFLLGRVSGIRLALPTGPGLLSDEDF